jgi:signal transduction histidine kinase
MAIRADEVTEADLASIEWAATDYIEAWLTGDSDRMADCLHPDLVKRSLEFDPATGDRSLDRMTHRDMVEATAAGRGTELPRDYTVTVFDAFRNVASARVDSARYVDYLHIGRCADRWRILDVLWEPRARG